MRSDELNMIIYCSPNVAFVQAAVVCILLLLM